MTSQSTKGIVLTSVGTVLVVLSVIFMGCFSLIFTSLLNKMLIVDPEGKMFESFEAPGVPIYMDFYIFNVTNAEAVQHYGAKPEVVELGPYSYLEKMKKKDYVWRDNEGTVEYRQDTTYFFDQEKSNGTLTDKVTILNPVMVVTASRIHELAPLIKAIGEIFFLRFQIRDNLFITKTVSEILFEGYYDPLVEFLGKMTGDPAKATGKFGFYYNLVGALTFENKLVTEIVWPQIESGMNLFQEMTVDELIFEGFDLPEFDFQIPFINKTEGLNGTIYEILLKLGIDIAYLEPNKIGMFYGKNGTDDGVYKVKTGALGMDDYLHIQEWEHEPALDYWNDTWCNMINGTDGTQYPPGVDKTKDIQLFTTDLCRSANLVYERDSEVVDIVSTYRYIIPPELLLSPDHNPDNECYCIPLPGDDGCLNDGMMNIQPCLGVPIVLSTPHFYQGDEEDVNKIDGLRPQKDLHETYLDVEPTTGVVMEAAKRIQMNLPLKQYGSLPSFKNVPEVIFPLFWISENAQIPETSAKSLDRIISLPYIIVYVVCSIIIIIGLILIVTGVVKLKRSKNIKKKNLLVKH